MSISRRMITRSAQNLNRPNEALAPVSRVAARRAEFVDRELRNIGVAPPGRWAMSRDFATVRAIPVPRNAKKKIVPGVFRTGHNILNAPAPRLHEQFSWKMRKGSHATDLYSENLFLIAMVNHAAA